MQRYSSLLKMLAIFLAASVLLSSCSSYTLIQSEPPGARLFINGEPVGSTPYTYADTKIVGSVNEIWMEKEGYLPLNASFSRSEEVDIAAIIGGLFFTIPFLWVMKYKPIHTYEMVPDSEYDQWLEYIEAEPQWQAPKSKAERLRELKLLLDEEILTKEEFNQEKLKILNEEDN